MKLFLKTRNGSCDASAEYDSMNRVFVVYEGSVVTDSISQGTTFRGARTVKKLRAKYVRDRRVTENVYFHSASTAANFITGTSTNGLMAWKDKEGRSLKEILDTE